jgi:hypothetical protein
MMDQPLLTTLLPPAGDGCVRDPNNGNHLDHLDKTRGFPPHDRSQCCTCAVGPGIRGRSATILHMCSGQGKTGLLQCCTCAVGQGIIQDCYNAPHAH